MLALHSLPRGVSHLCLLTLVVPLAMLLLAGCNSMAASAPGDPGGVSTGNKADVVAQVDGGPQYVDSSGRPTSDASAAAKDRDGNKITEIDQARDREPFAYKLSNMVGQNRIASN